MLQSEAEKEEELREIQLAEQKAKEAEMEKFLAEEAKDREREELIYVASKLLAGIYAGRQSDIDKLNHDTISRNAVAAAQNLIKEVDKKCSEITKKEP